MEKPRSPVALVFALLLILSLSIPARAHEVPDLTRKGTISIVLDDRDGRGIPGGSLTIYRVGKIVEDDGSYSFALTGAFAKCDVSLDDLQSRVLIASLEAWLDSHPNIKGTTVQVGSKGLAEFKDQELGLYLVVQQEAAPGYNPVSSFLISLPQYDEKEGKYDYTPDASPKTSDVTPVPPTCPTCPPKPTEPSLPQTGQVNWPIPLLAALGLSFFTAGWLLRFGKRETHEK